MKNALEVILRHPIASVIVVSALGDAVCRVVHGDKVSKPLISITINKGKKDKEETQN